MNKGIKSLIIVGAIITIAGFVTFTCTYKSFGQAKQSETENTKALASQSANVEQQKINEEKKQEALKKEQELQKQKEAKAKLEAKQKENEKIEAQEPTQINSILKIVSQKGNLDVKYRMMTVTKNTVVYSEANESSQKTGYVSDSERVRFISSSGDFTQIKYCNSEGVKEGFVPTSTLKNGPIIPNNFNNLVVPSNVKKVKYGISGQGRGLYYYKIGNGSKELVLNFAIHGYEDSWMQDGFTLTQMAEYVIKSLSQRASDEGLNGWTVYVIPSSNPDGLVNGYTNNGPGRAQISESIDMNRDFQGPGFVPNSTPRNNTGEGADEAPEVKALEKLIKNLADKNSNLVVVDTHGWLNYTVGNTKVAPYFDQQFGLSNKEVHVYNGGYFVGYAKMEGARELLVELPDPASPNGAAEKNYNQKMANAVNNLISNYSFD